MPQKSNGEVLASEFKRWAFATVLVALFFTLAPRIGSPGGQFPPDMGKITLVIICGMCVNELHWIGYWVLVTLSGNS